MGITAKLAPELEAKQTDNGVVVNPKFIAVNPQHRARYFNLDQDHVLGIAEDMAQNGHEVPVKVWRTDDEGHLELIFGHHRLAAANLINTDKDLNKIAADHNHLHPKTGVFMLKVQIAPAGITAEDAFLSAISENELRKQSSIIDDMHNQKILRDEYGWDDDRIAKRYKVGKPWVQRTATLAKLTEEEKQLVHTGVLTVMEGMNLAGLTAAARKEVIESSTAGGVIDKKELAAKTRDARNKEGKSSGRSVAEIRKDFQAIVDDENSTDAQKAFAKSFLSYVKGKVGVQGGVLNALARYCNE